MNVILNGVVVGGLGLAVWVIGWVELLVFFMMVVVVSSVILDILLLEFGILYG